VVVIIITLIVIIIWRKRKKRQIDITGGVLIAGDVFVNENVKTEEGNDSSAVLHGSSEMDGKMGDRILGPSDHGELEGQASPEKADIDDKAMIGERDKEVDKWGLEADGGEVLKESGEFDTIAVAGEEDKSAGRHQHADKKHNSDKREKRDKKDTKERKDKKNRKEKREKKERKRWERDAGNGVTVVEVENSGEKMKDDVGNAGEGGKKKGRKNEKDHKEKNKKEKNENRSKEIHSKEKMGREEKEVREETEGVFERKKATTKDHPRPEKNERKREKEGLFKEPEEEKRKKEKRKKLPDLSVPIELSHNDAIVSITVKDFCSFNHSDDDDNDNQEGGRDGKN
jgi:hypothetical protein